MKEIDDLFASSDPSDTYSAIIQAGKKGLLEYHPRVVPFLDSQDRDLRKAAIWTLAFFWALPEFEAKAREMAYHDPDELVRGVAISGWSRFHAQTKDRALILEMLAILLNRDGMPAMRGSAYRAILTIAGIERSRFPNADVYPDIDKNVDWKLVREMVVSAGIESPAELDSRLADAR